MAIIIEELVDKLDLRVQLGCSVSLQGAEVVKNRY